MALKRNLLFMTAGLALVASCAWAQPYGMGPGMMGGDYGHGGYGMGQGMMGGCGGGPGYGPGPGMHPGMMWGWGGGPELTNEQRTKMADIQRDCRRKQWDLMEKMHDLGWRSGDYDRDGKFDEQAARKAYDQMAALRKQMFENGLEARRRMDAVLTPQQREQMTRGWRGR